MANPTPNPDPWQPTLVNTKMATRFVGDREAYLGNPAARQIGRRIDHVWHELFVVCAPADALALEFQHLSPDFMVLHDLGGAFALEVLRAAAQSTQQRVQQLVIRRQGFGDALAKLHFLELPALQGEARLRIYASTPENCEADESSRLALTLLAHSRFGVLLTGPATGSDRGLEAVVNNLSEPFWRNRRLMLVPMSRDLPSSHLLMGAPQGLTWNQAPPCAGPGEVWACVAQQWNTLHPTDAIQAPVRPATASESISPPLIAMPVPAALVPKPMPSVALRALPEPVTSLPAAVSEVAPSVEEHKAWAAYTEACVGIPGHLSSCVFELNSQRALCHAGTRPGPAALAVRGAELYAVHLKAAKRLGLEAGEPDITVTLAGHHVILHPLPGHPGKILHAVFVAMAANLMLVRARLQRIDRPSST